MDRTVNKNLLTGLLFMMFALVFGINGLRYQFGNFADAGPGLFPVVLSVCLFLLGLVTVIKHFLTADTPVDFKFKNIAIVSAGLLGFAVTTQYLGMLAGTAVLVSVTSACATSYSVARVVKITVGLVVIAVAFKYLLGLNLPL